MAPKDSVERNGPATHAAFARLMNCSGITTISDRNISRPMIMGAKNAVYGFDANIGILR
jgi:hypothetical protein